MAVRRILILALWCEAAAASASPRTDPTVGRAVFTGATMPHATSIDLDPAALGLGTVDQLYVAATGVADQFKIALDAPDGSGPGAPVRDVELGAGGMFAFIYHLAGDSFSVGFEAHAAPPESFPGQRAWQYHVLGGGERDLLATAGASYKIANELYVGASVSHQNTFLRLRYARDAALGGTVPADQAPCRTGPCGIANPEALETWDVGVRSPLLSTANLRVNVGAMVQIARDLWLGVAYHTPPESGVQTELAGNVDIARARRDLLDPSGAPLPDAPDRVHGQSVVEVQFPASVDAELRARLPRDLDLHVAGRWEDTSRLTSYDVRAFGSTLPRLGVPEGTQRPRGLHDSFAGWAGVEQVDRGQTWLLGARAGYESASLTTARTSPLTIAPASFTVDVGAQLRVSRGLVAQLSYGLQWFPTVTIDADRSAFRPQFQAECIASQFDYTTRACQAARDGYAIASAGGSYDRVQHAVRFGLRYDLP